MQRFPALTTRRAATSSYGKPHLPGTMHPAPARSPAGVPALRRAAVLSIPVRLPRAGRQKDFREERYVQVEACSGVVVVQRVIPLWNLAGCAQAIERGILQALFRKGELLCRLLLCLCRRQICTLRLGLLLQGIGRTWPCIAAAGRLNERLHDWPLRSDRGGKPCPMLRNDALRSYHGEVRFTFQYAGEIYIQRGAQLALSQGRKLA